MGKLNASAFVKNEEGQVVINSKELIASIRNSSEDNGVNTPMDALHEVVFL